MSNLDPKDLRQAFGSFMTGVTVITARTKDGSQVGFTANSFTSVSLDPPLLLVCPGKHLSSYQAFAEATSFAVSVLAEGQEGISNRFAKSGADRFALGGWEADHNDCALIEGRAAGFSCRVEQHVPAGDHIILIGRVTGYDQSGQPGLGYGQGGYFSLSAERQADASGKGQQSLAQVILESDGQVWLNADGSLPSISLQGRGGARSALQDHCTERGLQVALGPVFSVYDDAAKGTHHTVFRATLTAPDNPPGLRPVALDDLPTGTDAETVLLSRFAQEYRNQNFGLYIGDADSGDIHDLDKG